jgi:hypothetical protein
MSVLNSASHDKMIKMGTLAGPKIHVRKEVLEF